MPYVVPTPAAFKARFPDFNPVADARIQIYLDDAVQDVGLSWRDDDRARGQMLLAAHLLTLQGEPTRSTTGNGTGSLLQQGSVQTKKVGDVEKQYNQGLANGSSSGAKSAYYAQTPYGQEFWILLRRNTYRIIAV